MLLGRNVLVVAGDQTIACEIRTLLDRNRALSRAAPPDAARHALDEGPEYDLAIIEAESDTDSWELVRRARASHTRLVLVSPAPNTPIIGYPPQIYVPRDSIGTELIGACVQALGGTGA